MSVPVIVAAFAMLIGGTVNAPLVTVRATVHAWDTSLTKSDTVRLVDCLGFNLGVNERYFVFNTPRVLGSAPSRSCRRAPSLPEPTAMFGGGLHWG
jgi:hypothetical protein